MTQFRKYGLWLALLSTALMLSSCGIKPKKPFPPEGAEKNGYPRQYPSE